MKEQIEEMARKICCNHYNGDCVGGECICQYECIYAVYANRLYNAGYRKQNENTVEVVRCKDCKWWEAWINGSTIGRCENPRNGLVNEYSEETDFCSYGERKE